MNNKDMKKYVFAFLFLMLSLPVQADTQRKSLNQLIYDYSSPAMRDNIINTAEKEKVFKQKQKEINIEKRRAVKAKEVESTIKYCDGLARAWNKAEGKQGKNPSVYYDNITGECVTPETQSAPDVIFVAPLGGHW